MSLQVVLELLLDVPEVLLEHVMQVAKVKPHSSGTKFNGSASKFHYVHAFFRLCSIPWELKRTECNFSMGTSTLRLHYHAPERQKTHCI